MAKLYSHADEAGLEGDEEREYVLLLRYFNLFSILHKSKEFQTKKDSITDLLGGNAGAEKTMSRLEHISQRLRNRYQEKNKQDIIEKMSLDQMKVEPVEDWAEQSPERGQTDIDAKKLFDEMKSGCCSMLLLDCRPHEDFKQSRIKFNFLLNVPEEVLYKGTSVGKIHEFLSVEDRKLWSARAFKDNIVLLDWKSTSFKTETPIWILKDILENVSDAFRVCGLLIYFFFSVGPRLFGKSTCSYSQRWL